MNKCTNDNYYHDCNFMEVCHPPFIRDEYFLKYRNTVCATLNSLLLCTDVINIIYEYYAMYSICLTTGAQIEYFHVNNIWYLMKIQITISQDGRSLMNDIDRYFKLLDKRAPLDMNRIAFPHSHIAFVENKNPIVRQYYDSTSLE
jgi:hypothetical protein